MGNRGTAFPIIEATLAARGAAIFHRQWRARVFFEGLQSEG